MAIMLAKTYHALKAAGAPEDDAIAAAEELAEYENRLTSIDNRLSIIEARLTDLENGLAQFRGGQCPLFGRQVTLLGRWLPIHDVDLGGRDQCRGDDCHPRNIATGSWAIAGKRWLMLKLFESHPRWSGSKPP
jgi:hypothetical protein